MVSIVLLNKLADLHINSDQSSSLIPSTREPWSEWINRKINGICLYVIAKFSTALAFFYSSYANILKQKREINTIPSSEPAINCLQINDLQSNNCASNPTLLSSPPPSSSQARSILLRADEAFNQANRELKQGNKQKAMELFKLAAELNHLSSLYMLGNLYSMEMDLISKNQPDSHGLTAEYKTALKNAMDCYEKAALREHLESMYELGKLLIVLGVYYKNQGEQNIENIDQISTTPDIL